MKSMHTDKSHTISDASLCNMPLSHEDEWRGQHHGEQAGMWAGLSQDTVVAHGAQCDLLHNRVWVTRNLP